MIEQLNNKNGWVYLMWLDWIGLHETSNILYQAHKHELIREHGQY